MTLTVSGTPSVSGTSTGSGTASPSGTGSGTGSGTSSPTPTGSGTTSDTQTNTPSVSGTGTGSGSGTDSSSQTPTKSASATPTLSGTGTRSGTETGTPSPSLTASPTPSKTGTSSKTATPSSTVSVTPTRTTPPSLSNTPAPLVVGAPPPQSEALAALVLSQLAYARPETLRAWEQADSQACGICPLCTQVGLARSVTVATSAALGVQGFVMQPVEAAGFGVAVSFRGTVVADFANLAVVLSVAAVPYAGCRGCRVHAGFLAAYSALAPLVLGGVQSALPLSASGTLPTRPLLVTGHSLGGAMATIAAFELSLLGYNVRLLTFGSPRVGNAEFAAAITSALTTHRGVLMGTSTVPLPAGLSPLRRRGLLPEGEAAADEFARPSAVLNAIAERLCGSGCGGSFSTSGINNSAYAAQWNEHIAGRSSHPASARKLQGGGGAAPATRELWNMWRYVNGWDPVPTLPPTALGFVHVPTELFFTGTAGDGWGLRAASASVLAPPFLGDYSSAVPTSAYEAGRLPALLLDDDHFGRHYHDLSEYAYRLLDPVYLRGAGSASVGFWGPSTIDAAARPLGSVYGRAQGLQSYACPSLAPSASPTAWSRPSCDYAPKRDSSVSISLSDQALTTFRLVRTITAAARATFSLATAANVDVEAVAMAVLSVSAAYTGTSPNIVLGTFRRLTGGASGSASFELVWNLTKNVASAWLPAANESLLSDSDYESFDDALFFSQQHVNATLLRLDDMLNGVAAPTIDCASLNATLRGSPAALVLGCDSISAPLLLGGANSSTVPRGPPKLFISTFIAAACNISVPQALALKPAIVFSTATASISDFFFFERLERPQNNTAISAGPAFSAGAVSGFAILALAVAGLIGFALWRAKRRRAQKKVAVEELARPAPPTKTDTVVPASEPASRRHTSSRRPNSESLRLGFLGSQRSLREVSEAPCSLRIGDLSVLPPLSSALSGSLRSFAASPAAPPETELPGFVPDFVGGAPLTPPPDLPPLDPKLVASMVPLPPSLAASTRSRAFVKHAAATIIQSMVRSYLSRCHMKRFRALVHAALEERRAREANEALLIATREAVAAAVAAAEAEADAAAEAAALAAAEAAAAQASKREAAVEAAGVAGAEAAAAAAFAAAAESEAAAAVAAEKVVEADSRAAAAASAAAEALADADAAVAKEEAHNHPLLPAGAPQAGAFNSGAALLMARITAPADSLSLFVRGEAQRTPANPALLRLAEAQAASLAAAEKERTLAGTAADAQRRAMEAKSHGHAVLSAEWAASLSRAAAARARLLEARANAARGGAEPAAQTFRRF